MSSATTAFTIGAPPNTIAITAAGDPFAPNASRTQNAPNAPAMPATSDHHIPATGKLQRSAIQCEHAKWREHRGEEICDADEEKRFVSAIDRIAHAHLSAMQQHPVNAPREHCHQ